MTTGFPMMSKLKELHLDFRDGHNLATKLRAVFKKEKPSMPSIKTIKVGCNLDLDFIIDICTNLENLTVRMDSKWKKNLEAASNAPKLKYVELERFKTSWKPSQMEGKTHCS